MKKKTSLLLLAIISGAMIAGTDTLVAGGGMPPPGSLFFDDFTRHSDPGPLWPWTAQSGNWSVTGGSLVSEPADSPGYGTVFVDTNWTDFSIQGQIRFSSANTWGGGFGGRLNAASGARYAAWVYPEGSGGANGGMPVLRLVKFQDWTDWGYQGTAAVEMQAATLSAPVGTNSHTLQIAFRGNEISVYFDGQQMIDTTDEEAEPYPSGGITVERWADSIDAAMFVGNFLVEPAPQPQTITFNPPADTPYSASFSPVATASSGLPVQFAVLSGPATISNNLVCPYGIGLVTLSASQSGDAAFAAAPSVEQSFNATPALLTGRVTVRDKVYDGSSNAVITGYALGGVIGNDDVSLTGGTACFTDKNAAPNKTVVVTGLSLTGASATNYTLANGTVQTAANITARPLTVRAVADARPYDGTTADAVVPAITSGSVAPDDTAAFVQAFADKNIGTGKTLSVSGLVQDGNGGANYMVSFGTVATGAITPAIVTPFATAGNKPYDGTAAATIISSSVQPVFGSDQLSLAGGSASFSDPNAGTAKMVTISGLSLTGADAGNYRLVSDTATATADITPGVLLVSADNQIRGYGATNPILTASISGFIAPDNTGVISGSPALDCSAVSNSPVAGSPYLITVTNGTLSAQNYDFRFVEGELTITQAVLTVSAVNQSKLYGSPNPPLTVSYSGFTNGEDTNVLSGTPALTTPADVSSPVAGGPYPIQVEAGTLTASNYSFVFINGQLTVAAAALTPGVTVAGKTYDGTTNAGIATRTLAGVFGGDDVTLSGGNAGFADKNAGTAKPVAITSLSLAGAAAPNYVLATNTVYTQADIAIRALTISAAAQDKPYDGTANADVTLTDDRLPGDQLATAFAGANFADKNAGQDKTVTITGIAVTGLDAGNYSFNGTATVSASITPRPLSVSAVADAKTYDGTTASAAAPAIASGSIAAGDTAAFAQTFSDKNAGTSKSLTVSGSVLDGNGGSNYDIAFSAAGNGVINRAYLTVAADNKVRPAGMPNPALTSSFSGFVGGDDQSVVFGTPDLSTVATPGSPAGVYPITIGPGTLSAANYIFGMKSGLLTVLGAPQMLLAGTAINQFVFGFPTVSGQQYQVEYRTDAGSGTWLPLGNPIDGTGAWVSVTNAMDAPQRFFRVNVQP